MAAMVRIEHMDFMQPMLIGEVAELTAEIVYTSPHSLLVEIKVYGENILTGTNYCICFLLLYLGMCGNPKVSSVSIFRNPNHGQKVEPEVQVSEAFLKTGNRYYENQC